MPSLGRAQIGLIPARKKGKDSDHDDDDDVDGDDHDDHGNYGDGDVKGKVRTGATTKEKSIKASVSADRVAKLAASASTASIVEALLSIIRTQDERIRLESRSWETAQEEADKALEERKEKMKVHMVDEEVQVDP